MRLRGAMLAVVSALSFGACGDSPPPAPSVVATPTPAPTPTPTPAALTCTLPPMPDCANSCCREGGEPRFDAEVLAAMDAVRQSSPEWFKSNGSLRVSNETYTAGVAAKVTELYGLCARGGDERGPRSGGHSISGDEVGIKRDNSLSQNIDIVIGSSNRPAIVRRFTCQPASF